MATRPIASGTVSFGLVSIPVQLYSTSDSSAKISLNHLHEECGSRVKYQYYCPTCDEEVSRSDLIKGYEFAKGQYVLFTKEELESMALKPSHSIEITEFVPLEQVDPIHFDRTYYLGPDSGGDKPYRLLSEAMQETGMAALAKYAARGKDYLVLVRPFGSDGLAMQQLRYHDEIRAFSEVELGEAEVDDSELDLAKKLVEQISSDEFEPQKYEDQVKNRMLEAIQQKVEGQELTLAPPEEPQAQIIDLMDALKASLAEAEEEGEAAEEEAEARKPPKRSKRKKAAKSDAKGKKKKKAAKE